MSAACLLSGFRAVSDDDYARVTIAARFAASPTLDPSGTSWLPVPFWLYGSAMGAFGDTLLVARATAFALGVTGAVLVWVAARVFGLGQRAALLGAVGAAVLPYGAWLSVAMVPEAPSAALVLLGAACLCRAEIKLRWLGALALGTACLCRYEVWASALTFAALTGWEAVRTKRRELFWPALATLLPAAAWLLHGQVRHGDALFFVARVSQYRAALGQPPTGWLNALLATPWAVVRFEPELFAVAAVCLGFTLRGQRSPFAAEAWRAVAVVLALVLLLVGAEASGGSATHHPERSLLPVFWFLALLSAGLVSRLAQAPKPTRWLPALALPLALAGSLLLRPEVRDSFVDRQDEERVGRMLRAAGASHVLIDTDDFGFFAVQAGLGAGRGSPLLNHDPRQRQPEESRAGTVAGLRKVLAQRGAEWLVTPHARAPLAMALGVIRAETPRFVVFKLNREALRGGL